MRKMRNNAVANPDGIMPGKPGEPSRSSTELRSSQSPVMRAWLTGDMPGALAAARALPADDPEYQSARAIVAGVDFDNGDLPLEQALTIHLQALTQPVKDVDLRASVLRNTIAFLTATNRLAEARKLQRNLESLREVVHPRLRLAVCVSRWSLANAEDNYAAQLAAIEDGKRLITGGRIPPERQGLATLSIHWHQLTSAIRNHDLFLATQALEAVRSNAHHALAPGWWAWQPLGAKLCDLNGNYKQGLAILQDLPMAVRQPNRKEIDLAEASLLIRSNQMDSASRAIERLAGNVRGSAVSFDAAEVSPADVAWIRGLYAIATRDTSRVWESAEALVAASESDDPTWVSMANEMLVDVELSAGRPSLARRLLDREDPERIKPRCRMLWTRLLWREGKQESAVDLFAKVIQQNLDAFPGYIARQLQFALEMTSYDVAQLWAMATAGSRSSSKADDEAMSGTIGRRARLLQLFDHHRQITRAHASTLLGCAPNTATRDLQALVEEGLIKRVTTSGHLRTSYFVRATDKPGSHHGYETTSSGTG